MSLVAPVFEYVKDVPAVKLLFGVNPMRIYAFGRAPSSPRLPYAVYGISNSNPENYLGNPPDIDSKGTDIEIFAKDDISLNECYETLRDALQTRGHEITTRTLDKEPGTDYFAARMEFNFWHER